jgi:hypothetical protein
MPVNNNIFLIIDKLTNATWDYLNGLSEEELHGFIQDMPCTNKIDLMKFLAEGNGLR